MPPRKKKYVKVAPLGPEKFVCYKFLCTNCKKVQTGECSCPIQGGIAKTIHYRNVCAKCKKKAKATL